jgi:hypothetical protein
VALEVAPPQSTGGENHELGKLVHRTATRYGVIDLEGDTIEGGETLAPGLRQVLLRTEAIPGDPQAAMGVFQKVGLGVQVETLTQHAVRLAPAAHPGQEIGMEPEQKDLELIRDRGAVGNLVNGVEGLGMASLVGEQNGELNR